LADSEPMLELMPKLYAQGQGFMPKPKPMLKLMAKSRLMAKPELPEWPS